MSSYYYQAYQNPLRTILGLAGLSIDAVCNTESAKLFVRQAWKVHMEIVRKMDESARAKDRQRDEDFLRSWHQSLSETRYFREEKPHGAVMSIREEVERFFR